jgi:2-polyprenyl-3-methyl-5-hydroxy-6-metoxy-1,4-benzoquinol methylase
MPSFKNRSIEKELLDRDDISFEEIKRNMQELEFINRHLGGHAITLRGIREFKTSETIHIMEIGCGGGDNLKAIQCWARKQKRQVILTGVDINAECVTYARSRNDDEIEFITSDYKELSLAKKPDLIFSSLFCHHFTEEELAYMLSWLQSNCRLGFFINDLQRHPVAYYSIKFLTMLFSQSRLVKNDAPLSVLRGMKKSEWKKVFSAAGISKFECRWKWAFRWLITCSHDS